MLLDTPEIPPNVTEYLDRLYEPVERSGIVYDVRFTRHA